MYIRISGVAKGGAKGAMAPPEIFGWLVNTVKSSTNDSLC